MEGTCVDMKRGAEEMDHMVICSCMRMQCYEGKQSGRNSESKSHSIKSHVGDRVQEHHENLGAHQLLVV